MRRMPKNRPVHRVTARREGRWWIVDAPVLDYRTQARSLAEVDEMARDLVAGALGVDPESFDLDVRIERPADVARSLEEAAALERQAQAVASRAALGRREAARSLRETYGLSAIDAARVLGVSRARIYQLLGDERRAG